MIKSFKELHIAASEKIKDSGAKKVGVIFPTDSIYIDAINQVTGIFHDLAEAGFAFL